MRNIRCVVEYDGTDFYGFQRQPEHETIQGCLERALSSLTGDAVTVTGAGRTDAGVHAAGQVVNFFTDSRIPVERWPQALNSRLPDGIIVKQADEVPSDFHARKSATAKTYRYMIWNGRFRPYFGGDSPTTSHRLWTCRRCRRRRSTSLADATSLPFGQQAAHPYARRCGICSHWKYDKTGRASILRRKPTGFCTI